MRAPLIGCRIPEFTLAIAVLLCACLRASAGEPSPLIESVCTNTYFDGSVKIPVRDATKVDVSVEVAYSSALASARIGTSLTTVEGDHWFLYAVFPNELWIYHGKGSVQHLVIPNRGQGRIRSQEFKTVRDLPGSTPLEFRRRLPLLGAG